MSAPLLSFPLKRWVPASAGTTNAAPVRAATSLGEVTP